MFTGIVQASVPVRKVEDRPGLRSLQLELPQWLTDGLAVGASVALDGVCLTVTSIERDRVLFDVIEETMRRTTLGALAAGDAVHAERSAKAGDEVGGHEISGHVDGTVEVVSVGRPENNRILTLRMSSEWLRYVFPKGFIALNGCSLTVVDVDRRAGTFTVHLIPETLRVTSFDTRRAGDRINFEIDRRTHVIVETVRAFLEEQAGEGGIAALARAAHP